MNLSLTIHDKHLQEANGVIQRTGCLVRMVANSLSRRCRKATKHALAYLVNCSNSNSSCKITLVCKLTLTLSSSVYSLPLFSRLVFLKVPELLWSLFTAVIRHQYKPPLATTYREKGCVHHGNAPPPAALIGQKKYTFFVKQSRWELIGRSTCQSKCIKRTTRGLRCVETNCTWRSVNPRRGRS